MLRALVLLYPQSPLAAYTCMLLEGHTSCTAAGVHWCQARQLWSASVQEVLRLGVPICC